MAEPQPAEAAYPPEPWRLRGELYICGWLLPPPQDEPPWPAGFRPLRLAGRLLVGAVWATYRPGGTLAYHEVAVGAALTRGLRPGVTIPWIWVDSAPALAGGRALWSIPKRLARFARAALTTSARDDGGEVAEFRFQPLLRLPGRWPTRVRVVQPAPGGARVTLARLKGRITLGRGLWRSGRDLAFIGERRPLFALRLDDAELVFGSASEGVH